MHEPSVAIRLRGLTRRFGDVVAVDGVDLVAVLGQGRQGREGEDGESGAERAAHEAS